MAIVPTAPAFISAFRRSSFIRSALSPGRHVRRAARDKTTILPSYLLAGQIVVVGLRDRDPVAGKHGAGLDAFRRLRTYAEDGLVAEFNGLHFAATKQVREQRVSSICTTWKSIGWR